MREKTHTELTDLRLKDLVKSLLNPMCSWAFGLLPLNWRKQIANWLFRQHKIPGHSWIALQFLDDFARSNKNSFHKFLWSNHLYYAETYEISERFESDRDNRARHPFFLQLKLCLQGIGLSLDRVDSILEVGCSLGHQLRMMETDMFPLANRFCGIDIDEYAVKQGKAHLHSLGSKIRLIHGDMENLSDLMGSERFDVVICTGVLMYLNQEAATAVVKSLLKHTNHIVGISGLAHSTYPNSQLEHSSIRSWDQSYIHNIERMISEAGGSLIKVLWKEDTEVDGNAVYLVFAKRDP
jgi:SAM-dependent methyltransferase